MSEADEFLETLSKHLPDDQRLILCGFPGDPNDKQPTAWRPQPWTHGRNIPFEPVENAYATIASFTRALDGSFRRRIACFGAGLALMIDDVGTKVKPEIVESVPPSAIVETSPGNFQWWYFLAAAEADFGRFDALIRGFIDAKLASSDPGMSGVTRVGRLPGFRNGKPKYEKWTTKLSTLNDRRFTIDELVEAFKIVLYGTRRMMPKLTEPEAKERALAFPQYYLFLRQRGMLKRSEFDPSGWMEMTCPWKDDHTGGTDTGAALRVPAAENSYYGGFRCHHGHCLDKGWGDLTDWINEAALEETSGRDDEIAKLVYEKLRCERDPLATKSMRQYYEERLAQLRGR
jgi:hypothetical protein